MRLENLALYGMERETTEVQPTTIIIVYCSSVNFGIHEAVNTGPNVKICQLFINICVYMCK